MRPRFATRGEAIDQYVVPMLGDFRDHYSADAIFELAFRWCVEIDENGSELPDTAGFELVINDEQFWKIAQRCSIE